MRRLRNFIIVFAVGWAITGCDEALPVEETIDVAGDIRGVVTDSETGDAIAQATVSTQNQTHSVTTDVFGAYELPNVQPGDYTLTAKKVGYQTASAEVNVDTNGLTYGDMVLSPSPRPGDIRGTVLDVNTDSALTNVKLTTEPFTEQVITNANGAYFFDDIPVGSYVLTAKRANYADVTHTITVVSDSTIVVDFTMEPAFGEIRGTVRYAADNQPVYNAVVYTDPATEVVFTDSAGTYTIQNVPELTGQTNQYYKVMCEKSGYTTGEINVNLTPGKITIANFNLVVDDGQ
jgi:hypothetical protein